MDKITVKDVKKHLSTKTKIKIVGKNIFSIGKNLIPNIKKNYKSLKEKAIDYVGKDVVDKKVDEIREKKEEKIDEKRNDLKQFIGAMEQDDEYRIGKGTYYLNEVKNELRKLNKKRIGVSKKGLSIFALSKLVLDKTKENMKNTWDEYKLKVEQKRQEREIEKQKHALEKKQQEIKAQEEKIAEIQKKKEALEEEKNKIMADITDLESKRKK